jgi:predicted transcriptional regulator
MLLSLKKRRAELGLRRAALAAKAGVTREYIARIETRVQEPSLPTLRTIAKALKIEAADLLA